MSPKHTGMEDASSAAKDAPAAWASVGPAGLCPTACIHRPAARYVAPWPHQGVALQRASGTDCQDFIPVELDKKQQWGGTAVAGTQWSQSTALTAGSWAGHSAPLPLSTGALATFTSIFYERKGLFWQEKPSCESG